MYEVTCACLQNYKPNLETCLAKFIEEVDFSILFASGHEARLQKCVRQAAPSSHRPTEHVTADHPSGRAEAEDHRHLPRQAVL